MRSRDYDQSVAESAAHHARSKTFSGSLLAPHADDLKAICNDEGIKTVLDYGCGKAKEWQGNELANRLGVEVALYDPAVPEHADERLVAAGEHYDLVILSHVLFWVPLADLQAWVLPRIYQLATKAVFIVETIGEPKKKFLSNEAAHPRGLHAIDWIELLVPLTRDGIRTTLVTEYRAADKTIYAGTWEL